MPISTQETLSLVAQICEEENLQVTLKESLKGGAIAGTTTIIGGLLGGPIGLAVGGTIGGITAAYVSHGKFKSVASVIRNDMTPQQREMLATSVRRILSDIGPQDALIVASVALQPAVKERVIQEVSNYFQSQLHMPIIN